jgi:hypothetical protein
MIVTHGIRPRSISAWPRPSVGVDQYSTVSPPSAFSKRHIGRAIKRLFRIGTHSHAVISSSFQRAGTSDVASEELAIDIHALEPGGYVLAISAVDRISGERARVSRSFAKVRSAVNRRGP